MNEKLPECSPKVSGGSSLMRYRKSASGVCAPTDVSAVSDTLMKTKDRRKDPKRKRNKMVIGQSLKLGWLKEGEGGGGGGAIGDRADEKLPMDWRVFLCNLLY